MNDFINNKNIHLKFKESHVLHLLTGRPMLVQDVKLASTLLKWFPTQQLGTPVLDTRGRHGQVPAVYDVKKLRDNTIILRAQNYVIENCHSRRSLKSMAATFPHGHMLMSS